ncbi:MAG: beta-glucosidase [Tenericutes bacterium HGW-Tenericutes-6]|nr:MAG: beta-glucosidase [Tenericutes bacterium HGW-Tenericutes-6]
MDIKQLLNQMTIEEKIGQLLQIAPFLFIQDLDVEVYGFVKDLGLTEKRIFNAGSVLGIKNAKEMMDVQSKYLKKHRLGIPLMFMADIIHGYETIFPVPLALSCSWNPKLIEKVARISAIEASTAGIHITFSPMADLVRDPRWGRVVESFGEDPYLNYLYAYHMVKGYQGNDIRKEGYIGACVKHFAAYGAAEGGRDYNTVDISRSSLHNYYMSGYKGAIDAGAKMIMTAFNVVDGIPATVNKYLLRDVLRDLWSFQGVTISDYDSLHQIVEHGAAKDDYEASLRGIDAGLDIEMASTCYTNFLEKQINEKEIDIKLLDEAVFRILSLKETLGLFENPYKDASEVKEKELVRHQNHLDEALKVAHESMVLLKNDDEILPMKKGSKIVLLGHYALSTETNGPWSWHGRNDLNTSLYDVLKDAFDIVYVSKTLENHDMHINLIKDADYVICAIGEKTKESGEAHSKADINLNLLDVELIQKMISINPNVITLLYHGRPQLLEDILESKAILETWFLGSRASEAIKDVLLGKKDPSGRLTMSIPRKVGQIPLYYNHLNTGRPKVEHSNNEYVSYYLDVSNEPRYPFGFGLSYATFAYSNLQLSHTTMTIHDKVIVSIDVKNTSHNEGYEVIQLYIKDHAAYISRPVKELKQFKKVYFKAKASQTITFEITIDQLTYKNDLGHTMYDLGEFNVMVGPDSVRHLKKSLTLIKE